MLTVQLTKLESTFDQIRKSYPKLKATDASLIAEALTLAGHHALASFDGEHYSWPDDTEKLTTAMVPRIKSIEASMEPMKKVTKNSPEEEPVQIIVGLAANLEAGEEILGSRGDLKTLLGDILTEGVEFVYQPHDLGWQWGLDRVNWRTVGKEEIKRKVKVKAEFVEGATGSEVGSTPKKKPRGRAAAQAVAAAAE